MNEFFMQLKNPYHHPLEYWVKWPETSWKVLPGNSSGTVPPGESKRLSFLKKVSKVRSTATPSGEAAHLPLRQW
jgi:hypothetical protein